MLISANLGLIICVTENLSLLERFTKTPSEGNTMPTSYLPPSLSFLVERLPQTAIVVLMEREVAASQS